MPQVKSLGSSGINWKRKPHKIAACKIQRAYKTCHFLTSKVNHSVQGRTAGQFNAGHNIQVRIVATFERRKESGERYLGRSGVTLLV